MVVSDKGAATTNFRERAHGAVVVTSPGLRLAIGRVQDIGGVRTRHDEGVEEVATKARACVHLRNGRKG